MELLQLRYFYESAKSESFAKTADKYMIPASSVSSSIKRLEEELGCKLFDRQSNRITINDDGKRLQNSLGVIFDELDQTVERIKNAKPQKIEIRILILAIRDHMSRAMLEYQKMHPNVHFVAMFDVNNSEEADFDIVIDKVNSAYSEYRCRELGSYPICFRAVPDHPLVGKELTMKDLRNERFITLEFELGMNSTLFECCKSAGFYPNIVLQTNDRQYFINSAVAGIGLGLWLQSDIAPIPESLVELNVTDLQMRHTLYIYYKHPVIGDQLRDFIDFLVSRKY